MTMRISARASDPAAGSRGFPWPVLEQGNSSFPDGVYAVSLEHKERGKSFKLTHEIEGAALISQWIADGGVKFVCAVASPVSAYRRLCVSESPIQLVEWDPDDLGEPPKFTPMIVAARDFTHTINSRTDGASRLWDGKRVELAKGARVAVFPTFGLQSGMLGLLEFCPDSDLESGLFRVEPSTEDGFKFKVYLAEDLFAYLHTGGQRQSPAGANIMTHVVSAALNHLKNRYAVDNDDDGWSSHPNLRALADHLDAMGLPHWSSEDFNAEKAATTLHPHKIPPAEDED